MPESSTRPSSCPRTGCTASVTYADHADVRSGLPLWRCSADHRGPRFIGFDGDTA